VALIKSLVQDYVNDLQKDNDTIKAYCLDLERFVDNFGTREADKLTSDEINKYLLALTTELASALASQRRTDITLRLAVSITG